MIMIHGHAVVDDRAVIAELRLLYHWQLRCQTLLIQDLLWMKIWGD